MSFKFKSLLLFVTLFVCFKPAFAQVPCEEAFECDGQHVHITDCDMVEDFYGNLPCGISIEPITFDTEFGIENSPFNDVDNVWGSGNSLQDFLDSNAENVDGEDDYTMDEDVLIKILSLVDEGISGDFRTLLECVNFNCINFYYGDILIEFNGRQRLYDFINTPTNDELAARNAILDHIISIDPVNIPDHAAAIAYLNLNFFGPGVDLDLIIREELGMSKIWEHCCYITEEPAVNGLPDPSEFDPYSDCLDNNFIWTFSHNTTEWENENSEHVRVCSYYYRFERPDCEDIGNIGSGPTPEQGQMHLFSDNILGFDGLSTPDPTSHAMGADNVSAGVNLYNGLAQSDISITSFSNRDLSIPIGLSYQSAGLEIDSYGSDVGNLWQLNNGNSITRQVNGLPDEFYGIVTGKGYGPQEAIGLCVALDGLGMSIPGEPGVKVTWHIPSGVPEHLTFGINIPIFGLFALTINISLKLQTQMIPTPIEFRENSIGYLHLNDEVKLGNFINDASNYTDLTTFNEPGTHSINDQKKFLEKMSTGNDLNDFSFLNIHMGRYIALLKGYRNAFARGAIVNTQKIDTEPDEYHFSIPEFSGKFVMDQQGNIFTIPHSDLIIDKKIDPIHGIVEFTVHTSNGKLYTFGKENLDGVELQSAISYEMTNHFNYYDTRILDIPLNVSLVQQEFSRADLDESYTNILNPFMCLPCAFPYKKSYETNHKIMEGPKHTSKWHLVKMESKLTLDNIEFEFQKFENLEYFVDQGFTVSFPNFKTEDNPTDQKFKGEADVLQDLANTILNPFSPKPYIYTGGINSLTYSATRMVHTKYKVNLIKGNNSSHELLFEYGEDSPEIYLDKLLSKITHNTNGQFNRAWEFEYLKKGNANSSSIECLEPVSAGKVNFQLAGEFKYEMNDTYVNNLYITNLHNFLFTVSFSLSGNPITLFIPLPLNFNFKNKERDRYINTIQERGSIYQIMAYHLEEGVNLPKEFEIWKREFQRGFLEKITEIGRDQGAEPFVELEYYRDNEADNLPKRFSPRKDLWGYFNNSPENTSYFTEFSYKDFSNNEVPYLNGSLGGVFHLGISPDFVNEPTLVPRLLEGDLESNKIMALRKVKFKTGAYYTFEYELHDWKDEGSNDLKKGAGLRVKQLIQGTEGHHSPVKTINYEYNPQPENGPQIDYGSLMVNHPRFLSDNPQNFSRFTTIGHVPMEQYITVSSSPINTWYKNKAHYVGYKKVIEKYPNNGSIENVFSTIDDHPPIIFEKNILWRDQKNYLNIINVLENIVVGTNYGGIYSDEFIEPNMPMILKDWRWGLALDIKTKNEAEDILVHESTEYTFEPGQYIIVEPCFGIEESNIFSPNIAILKNQHYQVNHSSDQIVNNTFRLLSQFLKFPPTPVQINADVLNEIKVILLNLAINIAIAELPSNFRFIRKFDIFSFGTYEFEQVLKSESSVEYTYDDGIKGYVESQYENTIFRSLIDHNKYNFDMCRPMSRYNHLVMKNSVFDGEGAGIVEQKEIYYYSYLPLIPLQAYRTNGISLSNLQKRSFKGPLRIDKTLNGTLVDGSIQCYFEENDRMLLDQVWSVVDESFVLNTFVDTWNAQGQPTTILKAKFDKKETVNHAAAKLAHEFFPPIQLAWSNVDHLLENKTITSGDGNMTETYLYTDYNELKKRTDIHNLEHEFTYDEFGRLLSASSTNGLVNKAYVYSFMPNVVTETTTFGGPVATPDQTSITNFDGFGKVDKVERQGGAILELINYDAMFRAVEKENLGTGLTTYLYQSNPLGRVLMETDAESNVTAYKYNGGSATYEKSFSSLEVTDANGNTSFTYTDGIDRTVASISGEGGVTEFTYDNQSRIIEIKNPDEESFSYTFNPMSQVLDKIVPGSAAKRHYYDNRKLLVGTQHADVAFLYKYDELNRLKTVYLPDGELNFGVNSNGSVVDAELSVAYAESKIVEDIVYRVDHFVGESVEIIYHDETDPVFEKESNYLYDNYGRVQSTQVNYPDLMIEVEYLTEPNGANMPKSTTTKFNNVQYGQSFDYDDYLRMERQYAGISGLNAVRAQTDYFYNEKDQLINKEIGYRYLLGSPINRILQDVRYEYDNIGRLKKINDIEEAMCDYPDQEIDPDASCLLKHESFIFATSDGNNDMELYEGWYTYRSCNIIEQVVINGDPIEVPLFKNPIPQPNQGSPFYMDLFDPEISEISSHLEEIIHEAGFKGKVLIIRKPTPSPGVYKLKVLVLETNIQSLQLISKERPVGDPCTFTFELDCCPEDEGSNPPLQMMQMSQGRKLFAQRIEYNGLDIEEIEYVNGCLTGVIKNTYTYDKDHRLIQTDNLMKRGFMQYTNPYSELYTYSPSGNIRTIQRNGIAGWDAQEQPVITRIDDMVYTYLGEYQLGSVADSRPGLQGFANGTAFYDYDGRGNVTNATGRKGYGIIYNPLDLPFEIQGKTKDEIWYTQSREKLRVCQEEGPQGLNICRLNLGDLELEWDNVAEEYIPKAWHHGEGKMMLHYEPQSDIKDKVHMHFYLRDHLGNTVVTFDDRDYDGSISEIEEGTQSEVVGRYHYYSFGMQWNHAWVGSDITGYWKQRLRYNGKELHSNSGLLDYGFRYYDNSIGRFTGVDPMAEEAPEWTPYRYGFNNPILFIDPDGLFESKADAKQHAKDNNIKTGWFSRNKIVKTGDGSYAIENRKAGTSLVDFGEDMGGVHTTYDMSASDVMNSRIEGDNNILWGDDRVVINTHRDGSESERPLVQGGTAPDFGPGRIVKGYKYLKTIKDKYDVFQKTKKAENLTGQSRAVWNKIFNRQGKEVRKYKDAYKPDGRHHERAHYKPHQYRSRKSTD